MVKKDSKGTEDFASKLSAACMFSLKPDVRRILWEVTDRCNAYCKHCSTKATEKGTSELDFEKLEHAFDEFATAEFNELYITGGEPFLRADIFELIDLGIEKFDTVMISTNGSLINEENAERIAQSGVKYVLISLDSIDADKHDEFRKMKGLYQKACNSVRLLSSKGVHVTVNSVITKKNYFALDKIADLAHSLGTGSLLLSLFLPIGRGAENYDLMIDPRQLSEVERKIENLRDSYDQMKIKYKRTLVEGQPLQKCPGGSDYLTVTSDGRVQPCPWVCEPEFITPGTLREASFEELYHSEELSRFRDLVERRIQTQECEPCQIKGCGNGCLALAKCYKDNYMEFDPFCDVNKKQ
jgi:AdoMet-dependent heme synthase